MITPTNETNTSSDLLLEFANKGSLSSLIIESSEDAIKTKTLSGIITSWNRGAQKIYGYTEAEIIGKHISILIPPNQPNELDELLKQISDGCEIPHYVTKRIRKDGIVIDASLALSPIKDSTGKIIGVSSVSRDITGRTQASQYARSLIEASLDPLVTISPKGKITDVNDATVKITGIERNILIGTDFSDYFTEPEKAREGYKKVFDEGLVSDYPLTIRHKNKKLIDVLYNASVYKDDKGNVLGVFAAARDITSQRQASQYSRSLIEASLDPLVTISIEGKITDVNEASVKVTGIDREYLIGTDFSNYFTEPEKAREGYKKVFEEGFVSDYPLTIHHKSGKLTPVLYNASVYKDDKGNVLGVFAAARDITAQQKSAEELIFKNEELEKAKELAESLSKVKDQFLASMSHEIRTPLNGIIGFTKILLRNGITENQKPQLEAIKTSSDILLVLINDILDLAKIEAGKMTIEATELKLSDLVNSILGSFEVRFQEKEIRVSKSYDTRIPKILIGDPIRINQILLNLLSNSIKFTKNGGKISIDVNLINQDDTAVSIELTVSDTGIGIPPEKLEAIFEPFIQSSSDTARKYGGTGLGLSIVKRLVDLMNGKVCVNSKINEGSSFIITLPFIKTDATEISKEIETRIHSDELKRLGKLKILLVEDIPINQYLAQTILHDFGFESDTAENGKIAIELLENNDYDIVLMDLMMPEMNGFETTEYIRKKMRPDKSCIPIIALTADVTKTDVERCNEVGMNEYVSKPINETDLLNKIAHLVRNKVMVNKICNLDYLKSHSPNNPKFLQEMIHMFLTQTPEYLSEMQRCLTAQDWNGLHGSAHKIRPSLDFLGLPKDITHSAKLIDDYSATQQHLDLVPELLLKVKNALEQAYIELREEFQNLNLTQN